MPQIIFDFLLENKNVKIHKDIKNSSQIIQMVLDGDIDLGVIETESVEPNIIKEKLGHDRLVVVCSDKKLANKKLYIDQLFSKKWILREKGSGTRELFLNSLDSVAKDLNVFMEFTEFEEMKTLLENSSDVISCVSYHVVQKELERGELYEVGLKNITLNRKLYAIHHKDKYKTKLFDSFLTVLVSSCEKKRAKAK
jgi:DNA-binding transcriptional LysR family regulator